MSISDKIKSIKGEMQKFQRSGDKIKRQLFIFGYYGWNNTGDDAMIYALLRELHISDSSICFAIFSQKPITVPSEVRDLVKFVESEPLKVIREIKRSSAFIIGGGTMMYDYGYNMNLLNMKRLSINLKILLLIIWAKLCKNKVYLLGIDVGSVTTFFGKFILKQIYRLSTFISVRDNLSYKVFNELGGGNKVLLTFDLATLLPLPSTKRTKENILGISILPFFEIYHANKTKDLLFIHKIAKGLNQWLKRDSQSTVYLFIFKGKSKADDVLITEMLQKQLEPSERVKLISYNPDPFEIMSQVAQCDAFLGMRYHSCLFAYLTNTPLLILNYFQKCQALAEDVGLPKHAVVSLEEILKGEFERYLKHLQEYPEDFVATLPVNTAKKMAKKNLAIGKILEDS